VALLLVSSVVVVRAFLEGDEVGPRALPTPTQTYSAQSNYFNGTGDGVTPYGIDFAAGPLIINASHLYGSSEADFVVVLKDAVTGVDQMVLVKAVGDYRGSRAFGIDAGFYVLEIQAEGTWRIELNQTFYVYGEPLPQTYSGLGDAVRAPIASESGVVRFNFSHRGMGPFVVTLLDRNGGTVERVVDERGRYSGSVFVHVSGIFIIDIQADGPWRMSAT
jgi:hypothetical protein